MQVQVQVHCDGVFTPTPQRGTHIDVNVTVRVSDSNALNTLSSVCWEFTTPVRTKRQGLHTTTAPRHGDAVLSVLNQDALLTQDAAKGRERAVTPLTDGAAVLPEANARARPPKTAESWSCAMLDGRNKVF
jgi:hypothetical protein